MTDTGPWRVPEVGNLGIGGGGAPQHKYFVAALYRRRHLRARPEPPARAQRRLQSRPLRRSLQVRAALRAGLSHRAALRAGLSRYAPLPPRAALRACLFRYATPSAPVSSGTRRPQSWSLQVLFTLRAGLFRYAPPGGCPPRRSLPPFRPPRRSLPPCRPPRKSLPVCAALSAGLSLCPA